MTPLSFIHAIIVVSHEWTAFCDTISIAFKNVLMSRSMTRQLSDLVISSMMILASATGMGDVTFLVITTKFHQVLNTHDASSILPNLFQDIFGKTALLGRAGGCCLSVPALEPNRRIRDPYLRCCWEGHSAMDVPIPKMLFYVTIRNAKYGIILKTSIVILKKAMPA